MATEKKESWCGASRIAAAARACEKRKRGRSDVMAFRLREGEECLSLARRLEDGAYFPEAGRVFVTEHPKHREVHAAVYRDRVVHHLLHALLEPAFDARFSPASFACRRGKGTHAAAAALQARMVETSRRGGIRVWALQMDVKNFFMSLHKPTLVALLRAPTLAVEARLEKEGALPPSRFGPWALACRILEHAPAASARRIGPARLFAAVPPHKRLGALGPDVGIPIGNLTSQFFANVYLSPLDHFITRSLGVGAYVRYVDDIVLLDQDRARLEACEVAIRRFLGERLSLDIRSLPIAPVSCGVDFVGYVVRPGYALPRRRVVHALREKLCAFESTLAPLTLPAGVRVRLPRLGAVKGPLSVLRLNHSRIEQVRAVWASYDGHLAHARAHRLRERLSGEHPNVRRVLARAHGRVARRFALAAPAVSFRAQVDRLLRGLSAEGGAARAVLLVQVGRFVEAPRDAARLGLRVRKVRGRRVAGAPWVATARLIQRALDRGLSVAVALEAPVAAGNVKQRHLAYLFEPLGAPPSPKEQA